MIPKDRRDESRELLVKAWYMAFGSYTEQEAKKTDSWRDQSLGQLFEHLAHEIEEIRHNIKRKDPNTFLVHNCMDACSLATILLAHVMEKDKLDKASDSDWEGDPNLRVKRK